MELSKTKVSTVNGLRKIPLLSSLLMERWYSVRKVWHILHWNKKNPFCEVTILYVDQDTRIIKDKYGELFIYVRPTVSLLST